mmetsp:Transcript_4911/g.11694  ORF Transcript_4911/g.11694 Transcript_4911/m.11694 type:complete len:99 (-) Transcript_4911:59-355(-)
MPCRHQLHVLQVLDKRLPTTHDIHQHWQKLNQSRAYVRTLSNEVVGAVRSCDDSEVSDLLKHNEYEGPQMATNRHDADFSAEMSPYIATELPSTLNGN